MTEDENQPISEAPLGGDEIMSQPEGGGDEQMVLKNRSDGGGKLESLYYSVVSHTTEDGRIIFGKNEIELFPYKEIPEYASPGTKAYLAKDLDSNIEYVAMLCGRNSLPRLSSIGSYRNMRTTHMLRLVAAGVVNWNIEGRQRFALIFEKPEGRKIISESGQKPIQVRSDLVVQRVIAPVVEVLRGLQNIDLVHGAIRLDNMYISSASGDNNSVTFKLGECMTSPPSMYQDFIYEPPLRSMVEPHKRGEGTIQDDLYALGICAAMLVKGENFLIGAEPKDIIDRKIAQGTYYALIGKESFEDGLGEFLRGVFHHDKGLRWTLDDCSKWLEGRRINPKKALYNDIAQRGFVFAEKEITNLSILSREFFENAEEAVEVVTKGSMIQWIRRNFDDKDLKNRFENVYQRENSSDTDKYMSFLSMAIDPYGPIRYKDIVMFPQGFGVALATAVKDGENLNSYGDLIKQQTLSRWVNQIYDTLYDAASLIALFEKCRIALNQRILGYGLERVLYVSNPAMPCMSPFFDKHYVLIPAALLLALEDISASSQKPEMVLDRHMVAFLSVRESKLIDPYLGYLNSGDIGRRMIGVLRVLNGIQRRFQVGSVPGVTKWISSLLQPTIDNFKDKDLKEKISNEVNKVQSSGTLQQIVDLIDDNYVVQEDSRRFKYAQIEYHNLTVEKDTIEEYLKMRNSFGRATGRQVAMLVSSFVALVTIALYSFVYFQSKM